MMPWRAEEEAEAEAEAEAEEEETTAAWVQEEAEEAAVCFLYSR